ncbi:MAG: hypothetical protein NZ729_04225 [Methylococcales bacterium]|nr:hypothetical protein [Methylococcales bacterium]
MIRPDRVCDPIGWSKRGESGAFFNSAATDRVSVRKAGPCDISGFDLFHPLPIQDFRQFVYGVTGRHYIVGERNVEATMERRVFRTAAWRS